MENTPRSFRCFRALAALAVLVGGVGCGGAAPATPTAEKPCDGTGTPPPGYRPSRKVLIACESVEIRADAPPEARETIVSRPRITTLAGRPATVTIENAPAGGAPQLFTLDLVANETDGRFSLEGRARVESGGVVVSSAEAPAQSPPVDRIVLGFAPAAGLAHEVRCHAGDPPAATP